MEINTTQARTLTILLFRLYRNRIYITFFCPHVGAVQFSVQYASSLDSVTFYLPDGYTLERNHFFKITILQSLHTVEMYLPKIPARVLGFSLPIAFRPISLDNLHGFIRFPNFSHAHFFFQRTTTLWKMSRETRRN